MIHGKKRSRKDGKKTPASSVLEPLKGHEFRSRGASSCWGQGEGRGLGHRCSVGLHMHKGTGSKSQGRKERLEIWRERTPLRKVGERSRI